MAAPPSVTVEQLTACHAGLLLDAYGVLVDSSGPLPGAAALLGRLNAAGVPFWVVTNDASRLPETLARRYAGFGLAVPAERFLTSGLLLAAYFAAHGLQGAACVVLGTPDSRRYVELAGGRVVAPDAGAPVDAVVVCDDAGYPFLETIDEVLSLLIGHFDRGDQPALILPNPDLIYPKSPGRVGVTSGGIALLLEGVLGRRYPERPPRFVPLGKPHPPLFAEAVRRAGTRDLVMLGDQLETDIAGAAAFGLASALVLSGVGRWRDDLAEPAARPTYLVPNIDS